MRKHLIGTVTTVGLLAIILVGCADKNKDTMEGMDHSKMNMTNTETPQASESAAKPSR